MARKPRTTKAAKPANAGASAVKADEIKPTGNADTGSVPNVVDPAKAGDAGTSTPNSGSNGDPGSDVGTDATAQSAGSASGTSDSSGTDETPKPAAKTQAAKPAPKAKPADDEPERHWFKVTGQIRRDKKVYGIGQPIDCTEAEFETFKRLGAIAGDWQE